MSWKEEVYKIIKENFNSKEIFTLDDIYKFEDYFKNLFPNNNSVKANLRRNLQLLRDENKIEFVNNRGDYRIVSNDNSSDPEAKNSKDTSEEIKKHLTTKEKINQIKNYIKAQGYTYPDKLIENFYLSLKTKPFVLLAGISGTGKTKLVELFARAIGCSSENDRFKLISVKPDWNDSADLLGYSLSLIHI